MNNYMGSMAMAFDFNNLNQASDADAMDQSAISPTSNTPHDSSTRRPQSQGNVTVYQTTGPDAHTDPIQAPGGSGQAALNPRSCVTCRKRKVRCDKQMPCSNCRRAQIPCLFPAPGRAPRQPRPKDPNAPPKNSSQRELELMKRLKKLEGIVEDLSGQIEVESGGRNPSSAGSPDDAFNQLQSTERSASIAQRQMSNTSIGGPTMQSPGGSDSMSDRSEAARRKDLQQQFGRLVLNDHNGSKRYVSSGFWAKINDELDSIREETQRLTDEGTDDSGDEATPNFLPLATPKVDHHSFILGYRSCDVDLRQCHPLPSHIPFLWSVYQENVEPLIKVLHVPSMEVIFRDARKNNDRLNPGNQALVFAIYYAAVTSLEPEEVQTTLGSNKDDLLTQYRFAVEQALSKANFLNASDLSVIQAFTIFLVIVRRHDESRFCWSLIGLLVHLAQGMGLHRDGSHFGLGPFETEMRRRLWWALLVLDLRSAEELGSDLIIGEIMYDTQMPSNINDADISPTTVEFPEPREGRSDTATVLVRYEICNLARRLVRASSAAVTMCPKAGSMTLADRERTLLDVYQRVETKFLKQTLSDNEPLYWMAAVVARVIMAKMCLVIYQPMLFPGSEYQLSEDIRQRIYVSAIEIIEYSHILNKDNRCRQFRWLFLTYTNWHAIAYTLVETCSRPWSALVERGWEALNGYERDPVEYAKTANHTAVFQPLRKLFVRARRHRAAELARLRADPEEARRLDLEERMNPAKTRFGPVPGTEKKMDQVRERWLILVQRNGGSMPPQSRSDPSAPASAPSVSSEPTFPTPFMSKPDLPQRQQPQAVRTPTGSDLPTNIDLSDAAMNLMDDLMNQSTSFPMASLWPLPMNELSNQINTSGASPATGVNGMVPLDPIGPMVQPNVLRQQALALQTQPPKDDHLPPYLWFDPFTSMNTKFDDIGGEDTDMLGEEFDWQDWSQNIRGLEMEATQAQNRW